MKFLNDFFILYNLIFKINFNYFIFSKIKDIFAILLKSKSPIEPIYKIVLKLISSSGYDIKPEKIEQLCYIIGFLYRDKSENTISRKNFEPHFFKNYNIYINALESMRYYFTIDCNTFSEYMIRFFKNLHGLDSLKVNTFSNFLSLFTENPKYDIISNEIKIPIFTLETVSTIASFYSVKDKNDLLDYLENQSQIFNKWCLLLNIDFDELLYFIKLINKCLSWEDMPYFIRAFEIQNIIDIELFKGLFAFFPKKYNEINNEEKKLYSYKKFVKHRSFIYNIFKMNDSLPNLILEIKTGNFWNINFQVKNDPNLKNSNIFPPKNYQMIVEIISGLCGFITNAEKNDLEMNKILKESFHIHKIFPESDIKSVAFLIFKHMGISPLISLIFLDVKKAHRFFKKKDKLLHKKFIRLIQELEKLT